MRVIKRLANESPIVGGLSTACHLRCARALRGFTLIEMLTVVSIMAVLGLLSVPALQSLQQGGRFTASAYNLADTLNLARTYAVANNTYVYVGLTEVNRTTLASGGLGRIAAAVVATKDGTSGVTASNLLQVRPTQIFDFLYVSPGFPSAATGNMARPTQNVSNLGSLTSGPTTTFSVPLNSTPVYNFNSSTSWVVCFNPQGGVNLNGSPVQWVELDIQPILGNAAPALPSNSNKGELAALMIEGATGSTSVYRP